MENVEQIRQKIGYLQSEQYKDADAIKLLERDIEEKKQKMESNKSEVSKLQQELEEIIKKAKEAGQII